MKKQQTMLLDSKKKNSVRYNAEVKLDANVSSVYIMNEAFTNDTGGMEVPKKIIITIEDTQ